MVKALRVFWRRLMRILDCRLTHKLNPSNFRHLPRPLSLECMFCPYSYSRNHFKDTALKINVLWSSRWYMWLKPGKASIETFKILAGYGAWVLCWLTAIKKKGRRRKLPNCKERCKAFFKHTIDVCKIAWVLNNFQLF